MRLHRISLLPKKIKKKKERKERKVHLNEKDCSSRFQDLKKVVGLKSYCGWQFEKDLHPNKPLASNFSFELQLILKIEGKGPTTRTNCFCIMIECLYIDSPFSMNSNSFISFLNLSSKQQYVQFFHWKIKETTCWMGHKWPKTWAHNTMPSWPMNFIKLLH